MTHLAKIHRPPVFGLPRVRWAYRCSSDQFSYENGQVGLHTHNEPELVLLKEGHLWVDVFDCPSMEGRAGDLFVLPARVSHATRSDGPWVTLCVTYSDGGSLLDTTPRRIDIKYDRLLIHWLEDLCSLHDLYPRSGEPVADALLLTILSRCMEIETRGKEMQRLHPRLAAAVEYLHEKPNENVTAAELAAVARTSYSHLSALFRATFGYGPLRYHREHRIERAESLLLNPYLSIGEIGRELGFDDLNYFARVFRQMRGISPHQWRRSVTVASNAERRR